MKIDLEDILDIDRIPAAALPRIDLKSLQTIDGYVLDTLRADDGTRMILMARRAESDLVALLWPNEFDPVGKVLTFLLAEKRKLEEDGYRLGLDYDPKYEQVPYFFPHVAITCVFDGTLGEDARDPSVSDYELRLFPG